MIGIKLAAILSITGLFAAGQSTTDVVTREEIMRAMLCLTGAMGGGILGMSFNPAKTPRQNLFLIFVNFITGVCFSPLLVEYIAGKWDVRPGLSLCLAVGAAVAAFAVILIKPALPVISDAAAEFAARFRKTNPPRP